LEEEEDFKSSEDGVGLESEEEEGIEASEYGRGYESEEEEDVEGCEDGGGQASDDEEDVAASECSEGHEFEEEKTKVSEDGEGSQIGKEAEENIASERVHKLEEGVGKAEKEDRETRAEVRDFEVEKDVGVGEKEVQHKGGETQKQNGRPEASREVKEAKKQTVQAGESKRGSEALKRFGQPEMSIEHDNKEPASQRLVGSKIENRRRHVGDERSGLAEQKVGLSVGEGVMVQTEAGAKGSVRDPVASAEAANTGKLEPMG
jgi:hypothetical protein